MNNPTNSFEPTPEKRRRSARRFSTLGMVLGILASTPYLLGVSLYIFQIQQPLARYVAMPVLFCGFVAGIPFGLAGMLLSILGWVRNPHSRMNVAVAVIGILLSLIGMLGHIWFFATCQFCQ